MVKIEMPYVDKINYTSEEAAPVTPENIFALVERAPTNYSDSAYFNMLLIAGKGSIPGSTASVVINLDAKEITLQELRLGRSFEEALRGGKLERLSLRFPGFNSTREGFPLGGRALDMFKGVLPKFRDAGYTISQEDFVLSHDMVQVPDTHPGFFCHSYTGKVSITTQELVKGKPERKFVLRYTDDMKASPEAKVYLKFLGSVGH